eukprot:796748_1
MGEKARFYPEYLTFLMCRLFKRRSDEMSDLEYIRAVYHPSYRHAFGTNLYDPVFDKHHKLILNSLHISVNYNRNYVPSVLRDDAHCEKYEYVVPRADESDIAEWARQCNAKERKQAHDCPYVHFIMNELRRFSEFDEYQISMSESSQFNELLLSLAIDHLICVHSFCSDATQRAEIKELVHNENGTCEYGEECIVLQQFSSRRRESTQEEHDAKNEQKLGSIKMNMIVDSLSMLHCYLQHKVLALYRENVGRNDNKFGTIVQHASKSLKYVDEFDVLMNQLLCSHEFQMAQVFVCMNRVDVWCSQHEFDFDALSDDVVDVARIESNFYHFLLSIKKEAYFDAIYKELFEMKQDGMDPDVMDELDALNAFLINHNAVPVPLFCRFQQWIKANDYNWNAIILDLKHGVDKSKIKQEFGGSIFAAINSFIREQRAHEQSAQIDNIAAINFGLSIHEWLEFNEEPTYRSF